MTVLREAPRKPSTAAILARRMAGDLVLIFSMSLMLSACARPKYLTQEQSPSDQMRAASQVQCDAKFAKQNFCVQYSWNLMPTETLPGSFLVKLIRPNLADQSPVPVDLDPSRKLQVELWMPSMEHGAPPITVKQLDIGTFSASEVYRIMRGEWEIHFNIMNGDQKIDAAVVNVSF